MLFLYRYGIPVLDKHQNKRDSNYLYIRTLEERPSTVSSVSELQKALFPPIIQNRGATNTADSNGAGGGVFSVMTKFGSPDKVQAMNSFQERYRNEENKRHMFASGIAAQPARWPVECQVSQKVKVNSCT